ncbi:hypothetical protein C9J20_02155 [Photobacterium phosphoreum]|nr:hypothetical protein CTM79_18360 [Photobacterium phosphoreum]PSW17404.1 hypothetical protein C9J20_02155 [Photobacterium phosphoreum]
MIYHNVIFFKNMERCPVCKNKTISLSMRLKSINGKIKCPYCKKNLNIKMNFLGMITLPLSIILSSVFIRENKNDFNYAYLILFWLIYFVIYNRFFLEVSIRKES